MNQPPRKTVPETPRSEPEIFPPDQDVSARRVRMDGAEWAEWRGEGVHRVFVRNIGPVRLFLWSLAALTIVAALLFLFASALLIAIPVIAALVVGSVVAARLRRIFRR